VPNCQKYTLTDGFFGDFTHWVNILLVDLVVQLIIGCLDKKASRNKIVKCQTLRQYLS